MEAGAQHDGFSRPGNTRISRFAGSPEIWRELTLYMRFTGSQVYQRFWESTILDLPGNGDTRISRFAGFPESPVIQQELMFSYLERAYALHEHANAITYGIEYYPSAWYHVLSILSRKTAVRKPHGLTPQICSFAHLIGAQTGQPIPVNCQLALLTKKATPKHLWFPACFESDLGWFWQEEVAGFSSQHPTCRPGVVFSAPQTYHAEVQTRTEKMVTGFARPWARVSSRPEGFWNGDFPNLTWYYLILSKRGP